MQKPVDGYLFRYKNELIYIKKIKVFEGIYLAVNCMISPESDLKYNRFIKGCQSILN